MFDTNMRHLPKDHKFICECWGLKPDTILAKAGVKKGDYLLATMLDEGENNPRVTFHLKDGDVTADSSSEGLFAYHILYMGTVAEGNKLQGFVYEKDLLGTIAVMEELELDYVV